jgi:hypothetical protein
MLFNLLLLGLALAIAYFHYTQGLFSSALSAILCIIAAVLAIGFHETVAGYVITYLKMPEDADAISLIVVFALAYAIGRAIFDKFCPGNVQFPLLMDKIGAGAMGLIAGIFATGIVALAAESMPFGPSIAGFSRNALQDRANITVQNGPNGRGQDANITDEVAADGAFQTLPAQSLWLHQDDIVCGVANQLSSNGAAFSWGTPLATVHPDYPMEFYGQRLGVPGGTRKLAYIDTTRGAGLRVSGVFALSKIPAHMDAEAREVRGEHQLPEIPADMTLVVVRVQLPSGAGLTDTTDSHLRLSCAGVRLKTGTTNYFPLGTMVGGVLLLQNRPDDAMIIDLSTAQIIDFLFAVNPDDLNTNTKDKEKVRTFKDGTFLEILRYARADLSGNQLSNDSPVTPVQFGEKTESVGGVLRKTSVIQAIQQKLGAAAAAAAPSNASDNKPAAPTQDKPKEDPLQEAPGRLLGL